MISRDICLEELHEWEFQMVLSARKLKHVDIPQLMLHVLEQIEISDKKLTSRLFIVLSELVNNALDHGLLRMDSALKDSRQGIEQYYEERAARLEKLQHGKIRIMLSKISDHARQCLQIDVCDSGNGFDHTEALSRLSGIAGEARHGRGIALVRHMGGTLSYKGNGSEVHVCLPISETPCALDGGSGESYITLDCGARNGASTSGE